MSYVHLHNIGDAGCGVGWMDYTFTCVQKMGGVDKESCYHYEAKVGLQAQTLLSSHKMSRMGKIEFA